MTTLFEIEPSLVIDRSVMRVDGLYILPIGDGSDESDRLFGDDGLVDQAIGRGVPAVFLAGTYYIATDGTVSSGAVLKMMIGATFSVATAKTLDASAAIVKADTTWYAGAGSTTVPTTADVEPGPLTVTGVIHPVGGIYLADKTTNSGTGDTTTIRGQNETGSASTGGGLAMAGGTGTGTGGLISCTGGLATSGTGGAASCVGGAATTGTGGLAACTGGAGTTAGGAAALTGGAATTTGGAAQVVGGDATTTGGAVQIYTGNGGTKGTLTIKTGGSGGTTRMTMNGTGIGFYANAAVAQPSVSGALSTVTDAAAKAVLTSIIAALKATTGVGLITDGTT